MREGVREALGEPDEIQKGGSGPYKYELWFYLNKDINRVYEFRQSAPGCGGSGQWYVEYLYYADYHFGRELYQPPVIQHEPVISVPAGQKITITAIITDDEQVVSADFLYRKLGEPEFTAVHMSVSETTYAAVIPAEMVTIAGLEYYIESSDGQHTSRLPKKDTYVITVIPHAAAKKVGAPETTVPEKTPLELPMPGDAVGGSSPVKP